jgi:phosphoribosylpyrophosphate synthetase
VYACATHGIFAGDATEIIARSALVETIVTNTIPLPEASLPCGSVVTKLTSARKDEDKSRMGGQELDAL